MKGEFIDHSKVAHMHETTAQIVGVSRGQDMYKKVSKKCLKIYDSICCNLSFAFHTVTNINLIYFCFISQSHLVKFTLSMDLPLQKIHLKNNLKVLMLKNSIMPLLELRSKFPPVWLKSKLVPLSSESMRSQRTKRSSNLRSQFQDTAELIEEFKLITFSVWLILKPDAWPSRVKTE